MLKRLIGLGTVLLLLLLLGFSYPIAALAQMQNDGIHMPATPEQVEDQGNTPMKTPESVPSQQRPSQIQVTYPHPPTVYDYETMQTTNEEIYGEQKTLPVMPKADR